MEHVKFASKFAAIRASFMCIVMAAVAFSIDPSYAAGGGGGGGNLPSQSQSNRVDPAESYREGIEALQAEDYKKAEKKFGEVLKTAPKMPEANYFMGLAKKGRGRDKSAVKYFKRAIKERPAFVEAREQLALASVRLDKSDDAQAELVAIENILNDCNDGASCDAAFVERTQTAINRVRVALGLGTSADQASDEEEEKEQSPDEVSSLFLDFGPAVQLSLFSRDDGVAQYVDAVKSINQEDYHTAIADLMEVQAFFGPHADILNYLGYSHRKLGQFERAKSYYAGALKINPTHRGATEYLGELYLEVGDLKRARAQLARLDEICTFGCVEREDLARLIEIRASYREATR